MKIRFRFDGPTGEVILDHSEISGMSDAQVETYVAAKVRKAYEDEFTKSGIGFFMSYGVTYHTKQPAKEINEV